MTPSPSRSPGAGVGGGSGGSARVVAVCSRDRNTCVSAWFRARSTIEWFRPPVTDGGRAPSSAAAFSASRSTSVFPLAAPMPGSCSRGPRTGIAVPVRGVSHALRVQQAQPVRTSVAVGVLRPAACPAATCLGDARATPGTAAATMATEPVSSLFTYMEALLSDGRACQPISFQTPFGRPSFHGPEMFLRADRPARGDGATTESETYATTGSDPPVGSGAHSPVRSRLERISARRHVARLERAEQSVFLQPQFERGRNVAWRRRLRTRRSATPLRCSQASATTALTCRSVPAPTVRLRSRLKDAART